jgi:hypothetical protein
MTLQRAQNFMMLRPVEIPLSVSLVSRISLDLKYPLQLKNVRLLVFVYAWLLVIKSRQPSQLPKNAVSSQKMEVKMALKTFAWKVPHLMHM